MGKNDDVYNQRLERVDTPPRGGNCAGRDLNVWFPNADKSGSRADFIEKFKKLLSDTKIAKQICSECKIKTPCLSYALYHENHGIWGGLTERERQTMRRRQGIKLIPREPINTLIPGMTIRNK